MKRSIGNIRYLGDGKYLLRVSAGFDDFGRRIQPSKTVECKNDKEAEIELYKFYVEKKTLKNELSIKVPETLNQLYTEWFNNHVKQNLEISTQKYYQDIWERYLKQYGKAKIKSTIPKMIYQMLENAPGERTKEGIYTMLKAMFNKAKKWEYIEKNPLDNIDKPKYESAEKDIYDTDEISDVFKALVREEIKYQLAVRFAVTRGLRREEVIGLKWSDIDMENKTFDIKRAAVKVKGYGMVIKKTKTKKSKRKLTLTDDLIILLKNQQLEQNINKMKLKEKWHDEDWVFTQYNGKIMSSDSISTWWIKFLKKHKLKRISYHDLRHTAASLLLLNGVDIPTVSEIVGHSRKSTTLNTYSHILESSNSQALNVLDGVIKNAKTK